MRKRKALLMLSLAGLLTFCTPALSANAAWKETSSGIIYTQKGSPGYLTGMHQIDKYWYYFNSNGIMQTGVHEINDKLYYFSEKGIMQKGWITAPNGKRYYADKNGVLARDRWVGKYYLHEDGTLATNEWINGKWVGEDGKYRGVKNNIGWVTDDDGKTYYYDTNSNKVKGFLSVGGKKYYLHPSTGVLQKGWLKINGRTYFAGPSKGVILTKQWLSGKYLLSDGSVATGLTKVGKKNYMFDSSGKKMTGWVKYKGHYYYFDGKGVMQKKKWIGDKYVRSGGKRASGFTKVKGHTYYFDPKTGNKKTGWINANGQRYFLNKLGQLQTGRWLWSGKYYASSSGAVLKGLNAIGGNLYYFDLKTGAKLTKSMKQIGADTYYFRTGGKAAKGKWQTIKGKKYYFDKAGKLVKNTWVGEYYVGPDGARTGAKKQVGLQTINGLTYCFDSNGNMMTGWQTINNNKHYFSTTGAMVKGIQVIGSKKYYFYPDGRLATDIRGDIAVGTKQYTVNKNGVVTAEVSLKVSDATLGGRIVNYALQFVGNKYVYGGTSLTNGADCSGFTYSVFKHFGINLLRVADDQMKGPSSYYQKLGYKKAVRVDINSIQPGDLIFYGSSNYASHVGIYMGNGKLVHASNSQPYPRGGIKVSEYDYQTPIRAVRYWY